MNKVIGSIGVILALVSAFFFLVVFSGGSLGNTSITGTSDYANFLAFFFVIVFLPVGAGLAFYGFAIRPSTLAMGRTQQVAVKGSSGLAKAGIALAIIAIILVAAAFAVMVPLMTNQNNQNSQLSKLQTSFQNSLKGLAVANVSVSIPVAYRVEWYNTESAGQDRFNPNTIVVYQGQVVQILFLENDTDDHTFTLDTGPYHFQINDTPALSHNFLTDQNFTSNCVNGTSVTYAAQTAGISPSLCVSGSSLLPAGTQYNIAINGQPLNVCVDPTVCPIVIPVSNDFFVNYFDPNNCGNGTAGVCGVWGIGAFKATQVGVYEFFCHYHVTNGMFGYLVVLPNAYCTSDPTACS
jgi:hypothetical protein